MNATATRATYDVKVNHFYANGDVRKTSSARVVVMPGDTLEATCKSIFGQYTELASYDEVVTLTVNMQVQDEADMASVVAEFEALGCTVTHKTFDYMRDNWTVDGDRAALQKWLDANGYDGDVEGFSFSS